MRTKWPQSSEFMSELLAQRTSWNLSFYFNPDFRLIIITRCQKSSLLSKYHKPGKTLQLPCIYCEEFHWLDAKQVDHDLKAIPWILERHSQPLLRAPKPQKNSTQQCKPPTYFFNNYVNILTNPKMHLQLEKKNLLKHLLSQNKSTV